MSDDYLWDRSGERDAEVAHLEAVLASYRYNRRETDSVARPRSLAWKLLAIAASLALGASLTLWSNRPQTSAWRIGGGFARVGQSIETGKTAGEKLTAQEFGEIELEPNSRLQLLASRAGDERVALRRGTMHALIWAPPSHFVVDTPSAKTIDLGCSYTLTVLPDGSGKLSVQAGWVAFQHGAQESFIPAGAVCSTRPRLGPGLPYFEDAAEPFRAGVRAFDNSSGHEGLSAILANARSQDGLTLWHLVQRTSGADREAVIRSLAHLVSGLDVTGLQAGRAGSIDRAWDALGLGGAGLWRMWKQSWRARS